MTARILRIVLDGRGHTIEVLALRIWPLALAAYCVELALAPSGRGIYGFTSHAMADLFLWLAASALVASAARPDVNRFGTVAMLVTTWTLMGRAVSFAYYGDSASSLEDLWPNLIGASIYVVLTLAEVILHLIQVAIAIDRRARG